MASRRRANVNKMMRDMQRLRRQQLLQLSRDYRPTGQRLAQSYSRFIGVINEQIALLEAVNVAGSSAAAAEIRGLKEFQSVLTAELDKLAGVITEESILLQSSGGEIGYRIGLSGLDAGGISTQFNQTVLERIQAGIKYTDSRAFKERVRSFTRFHSKRVEDIVLTSIARGNTPAQTVALINKAIGTKGIQRDLERFTRTIHVYSSRRATQAIYEQQGITHWVWVANIGNPRTCYSCISMHGTKHSISDVLNDHHSGRCAMAPLTPTWESLGFGDGGTEPAFQTGESWFDAQSEDTQQQILGKNAFDKYAAGSFDFNPETMSTTYNDPVYGTMRREKTLSEILATA